VLRPYALRKEEDSSGPRGAGGAAPAHAAPAPSNVTLLLVSWVFVGLPLAWGIFATLTKAAKLFH
jgi:hypothetical protein